MNYDEMELAELIEHFDNAIDTGVFPPELTSALSEWLWQLNDLMS